MGNPKINSSRIERPPAKPLPSAAEQRATRLATGHVVIVCGAQEYDDRDRVFAALDRVHERQAITLLVHGACMDRKTGRLLGVDRWADEWAAERSVRVERHPEDRATWGTSAAAIRAKQMVEAGAHGCVAFPGAAASVCKLAYRSGTPIWRPFGTAGFDTEGGSQCRNSACPTLASKNTPRFAPQLGTATVARVTCDGTDANAAMVRSGMAWAYTRYLADPQIQAMEIVARREHAGLWRDVDAIGPWQWRARRQEDATLMNEPITVYLDSSDYSAMSRRRGSTPELVSVRDDLLEFKNTGKVAFAYSGAHLSEMAPLEAIYSDAGEDRADLLVALCGRNAFVSFDRLITSELAPFANAAVAARQIDVLSTVGDWFPEIDDILPDRASMNDSIKTAVDDEVAAQKLNRKSRRALGRKLYKSQQPTTALRALINSVDPQRSVDEVVKKYPMRPSDALTLGRYFLGKATKSEAENAFLESLRDPRWMMRWFAAHHERLTTISEWVRSPGRSIAATMRDAATTVRDLRTSVVSEGKVWNAPILSPAEMTRSQDAMLKRVANRLLATIYPGAAPIEDVQRVVEFCPSLSTAVRALHSLMWVSVSDQPRTPLESDFVDAVHAMYAPHVDLFRADRFMAPHVQKLVTPYGTKVVSRLVDLPAEIRAALNARL